MIINVIYSLKGKIQFKKLLFLSLQIECKFSLINLIYNCNDFQNIQLKKMNDTE